MEQKVMQDKSNGFLDWNISNKCNEESSYEFIINTSNRYSPQYPD